MECRYTYAAEIHQNTLHGGSLSIAKREINFSQCKTHKVFIINTIDENIKFRKNQFKK